MACHNESSGPLGFCGYFGKGAVVFGGGGFAQGHQRRLSGNTVDGFVRYDVKVAVLSGQSVRDGERGFLGRQFRIGEVTLHEQSSVSSEDQHADRREAFLPAFGRGCRVEEGFGPGRSGIEREGYCGPLRVVSGCMFANGFFAARVKQGCGGSRKKQIFHNGKFLMRKDRSGSDPFISRTSPSPNIKEGFKKGIQAIPSPHRARRR